MIRTTELGELLVKFESRSKSVGPQSVRFDLNPYALPVLSDIRPARDVFPAAGGGGQWTKYDTDHS
jgi:hypothetical protein